MALLNWIYALRKKSGSEKKRQEHNLASGTTDGSSIEKDTLKRTWPGRFQGCFFNCQLGVKSNFVKFSLFYFFTTSWIAVGQSGTYWCRQRLIPAEKGILASSLKRVKISQTRIRKLQTYFSFGFSSKTLNWRCCLLKVLSKIPATSMHLFSSSSRLKKMWEILLCLLSARNTVLVDKTIKHFGMWFALKIESFFCRF